jgi:hypothetical protein
VGLTGGGSLLPLPLIPERNAADMLEPIGVRPLTFSNARIPEIGKPMKNLVPSISAALLVVSCATNDQSAIAGARADRKCDDLSWLVGKWQRISMEWLDDSIRSLGSSSEDLLKYFNVYLPYGDDILTLCLTDDPEDRPITAEFIVLLDTDLPLLHDGLRPMYPNTYHPRSTVRISKERLWVGTVFDLFEFHYQRVPEAFPPKLVLRSRDVQLVMEKISDDPGLIELSWARSDLRDYEPEKLAKLEREYERLREHYLKTGECNCEE